MVLSMCLNQFSTTPVSLGEHGSYCLFLDSSPEAPDNSISSQKNPTEDAEFAGRCLSPDVNFTTHVHKARE